MQAAVPFFIRKEVRISLRPTKDTSSLSKGHRERENYTSYLLPLKVVFETSLMVYKMQNVLSLHLEPLSYLVAEDKVGNKKTVYEKRITTELEKTKQS